MSIPASRIVTINPAVLAAGGNSLALNALFLTQSALMPTASVYGFASPAAVSAFFGPSSAEAGRAVIYFGGYDNSRVKPGIMFFAPYNSTARSAFLQSGALLGMTLAQLQALSGTLTVTIDGTAKTSSSINLSGATSFSNAATLIGAAFSPSQAVSWNPVNGTFTLTSPTTGANSTLTFATGTLATGLKFTSDTGAILSAGAIADTPASAMVNATNVAQNWVSFVTLFEPTLSDKLNFAIWSNSQNNRYLYLGWDSDVNASVANATTPFGVVAKSLAYNGVAAISGDLAAVPSGKTLAGMVLDVATFVAGAIASISFISRNGRITLAGRSQSGLPATCASDTTGQILLANGYSFYGSYATANQGFVFFYNGQMPGNFAWIDSFVNQVFNNSQLQLALMTLITTVGAVSYTPAGYSMVRAAMLDPIKAAINFGSIRAGVTLSSLQQSTVNQAAGVDAATQIQNNGFYLQVLDPGATARAARQTPIINFWYTDGGAIQQITIASIAVQ